MGPPSVTEERKPSRCRPSAILTCILETGIDVSPSLAVDAFCMCEHTCARLTRDMAVVMIGFCPQWAAKRAGAMAGGGGLCSPGDGLY